MLQILSLQYYMKSILIYNVYHEYDMK